MRPDAAIEALVRRDRSLVAAAHVVIVGLSWLYLVHLSARIAGIGDAMQPMAAVVPATAAWTLVDAAMMFAKWAVMLAGWLRMLAGG